MLFRFQKFEVLQNSEVFKVGTDAVLLGALANVMPFNQILEVGTGTGIISLMLAQRNPNAEILAIDIDHKAVELAQENFSKSVFYNRLKVIHQDYKNFKSNVLFDLIISNPPYFDENASQKNVLARQKIELDFAELIKTSQTLLSEKGQFSVIIPAESEIEFTHLALKHNFYLKRKINVYGILGGKIKRVILEYTFQKQTPEIANFVIEKSPRKFSDQYIEATNDFHVFR